MNKLPKSGGWLNSVKVVLGFLEVALAFKFFSNADLVAHFGILKRGLLHHLDIMRHRYCDLPAGMDQISA